MIKAIIFDCFGVLVGSGFKETYRQAGGDPDKDAVFIRDLLVATSSGLIGWQEMGQRVALKLNISIEEWHDVVTRAERPNEGLLDYIKSLKISYKVGILSNASVGTLQRKFNPDQLDLFDGCVVSAEVGMIKPNKDIYLLAAEKMGAEPEECVFVDDSQGHSEGARRAGMQAIWYQNFTQFKNELETLLAKNP